MATATLAVQPALSTRRRWTVLAVCALSLFLVGLDTTIVNVGLPTIGRGLGAGTSSLGMGRGRLHRGPGQPAHLLRGARGPFWPPSFLPERPGRVRHGVAGLRARPVAGHSRRSTRRSGRRGLDAQPRGPGDCGQRDARSAGTGAGDRRVGVGLRAQHGRWPSRRRCAYRGPRLAVGVLDQRTGHRRRRHPECLGPARVPRGTPPAARPPRPGTAHRRRVRPGSRPHRRPPHRLGLAPCLGRIPHHRGGRGGVHNRRVAPPRAPDGPRAVPAPVIQHRSPRGSQRCSPP